VFRRWFSKRGKKRRVRECDRLREPGRGASGLDQELGVSPNSHLSKLWVIGVSKPNRAERVPVQCHDDLVAVAPFYTLASTRTPTGRATFTRRANRRSLSRRERFDRAKRLAYVRARTAPSSSHNRTEDTTEEILETVAQIVNELRICCFCGTDELVCDSSSVSDGPICTNCFVDVCDWLFELTGE
jgi:hypothetical protein